MRVKSLTLGQFSLVVMVYKFDEQGETHEQKMVVSLAIHTDTSSVQNAEFTLNMNFNWGFTQDKRSFFFMNDT